jgi:uncharacterized membrane protein
MKLLIAYVVSLLAFVAIDLVWINTVVIDAYSQAVAPLIIEQPRLAAAIAFYLVYVGGLVVLAVRPAVRRGTAGTAWFNGAVLGAFAYGTYALTNYAMLADWTWHLVWTDMAWGVVISSLVSWIGFRVARAGSAGPSPATAR